jgi:integrase
MSKSQTLSEYYFRTYRQTLRLTYGRIAIFDRAVGLLEQFAGASLRLSAVSEELLGDFIACEAPSRKGGNTTDKHRRELASCIRRIVRHWNPAALLHARDCSDLAQATAAPNSLREHFEEVYLPQEMFNCNAESQNDTRRTIRKLNEFLGRDVMLSELTDAVAASFFRWLRSQGYPETTVNKFRRTLFSVWRHAAARGLVARDPKVKKLREHREDPDAWSLEEFSRIVDAAGDFQPDRYYGDVPRNHWWVAVLTCGYWTGLRRNSILRIRFDDVDLLTGWLSVPAGNTKTKRGRRCRLGVDAVEAVERIAVPEREYLFVPHPSVKTVDKHFDRILRTAGIPLATRKGMNKFHKVRRTAASVAYQAGGLAAAAALMDHSDPATTLNHYISGTAVRDNDSRQLLPELPRKPR